MDQALAPQLSRGFAGQILSALRSDRSAQISLLFLLALAIAAIFSTTLSGYDPLSQGDLLTTRYLPPSAGHLFGTDKFGRDLFSRVLWGARISLGVSLGVVFLSVTIGILYGSISGYAGGVVDGVMMRILDFLLAIPAIFLIMTVAVIFRLNVVGLILLLGLAGWMDTARLIRAEVLTVKQRDYAIAARGLGFGHWRVLFRHIVPNCLTPVVVAIPLKVAEVILLESALSFLGVGIRPPTPTWGNIINDGREVLMQAWWIATIPGLFIAATVMSFNQVGESLQRFIRAAGR